MLINNKDMATLIEHKIFLSKVQDVDEEKGIVTNYDNAFDKLDSDKDISRKGAFTKTLKDNVSRMKWFMNHNENWLIGVPFIAGTKEDDTGLLSNNAINLKKELGRDILSDYKLFKEYDRTLEHSIGYEVIKSKPYDIGESKQGRELLEIKLWEKSTLTSWGANEFTPLVGIKSEKEIQGMLEILEKMFTDNYNYSDTRKKQAEKLIKDLQSLSQKEPGETTLIIEPKQILESILFTLKKARQ
jgi:HK97 family phage prohead protease